MSAYTQPFSSQAVAVILGVLVALGVASGATALFPFLHNHRSITAFLTKMKGKKKPVVVVSSIKDFIARQEQYTHSYLQQFGLDPIRGFMPSQDPLQRLPHPDLQVLEDIMGKDMIVRRGR